jgi:hypothetical protein
MPIFAQDMKYVDVHYDILGQDAPSGYADRSFFFWGSSFDYAVFMFSNIWMENIRNKREQQRIENERQKSLAKLSMIKGQYNEYKNYPDVIIDGWHSAIATDNSNFCKDVKVFVQNNKITKFVINNYLPVNFTATREIMNAKNLITLQNFNGEQLNIIEIYFLYDIDEQQLVSPPINPGFVCFWTNSKEYNKFRILLNNERIEQMTVRFTSEPECFSDGMICRILKPGAYSYLIKRRGKDREGSFEIKEGKCLKFRVK